jgi:hypothetical protein
MKNIILTLFVLISCNYFSQENCLERVKEYYSFQSKSFGGIYGSLKDYYFYEMRNHDSIHQNLLRYLKKFNEYPKSSYNEYNQVEVSYTPFQSYLLELYKIKSFINYVDNKIIEESQNFTSIDSISYLNKKFTILDCLNQITNLNIKFKENILKYENEFTPLLKKVYTPLSNKKREIAYDSLCNWLNKQDMYVMEIAKKIRMTQMYSEWNAFTTNNWHGDWIDKLPEDIKNYHTNLEVLFSTYMINIKEKAEFNRKNFKNSTNQIAILEEDKVILMHREEKGFFTIRKTPKSTTMFLTGDQKDFNWNKSESLAALTGKDWQNTTQTTVGTIAAIYSNQKLLEDSHIEFTAGQGKFNMKFKPTTEQLKNEAIDQIVEFKISNDTLYQKIKNKWKLLYYTSEKFTKEFSIGKDMSKNAYIICDETFSENDSKNRIYAIGDKSKVLLMYYISKNYYDLIQGIENLKAGEVLLLIKTNAEAFFNSEKSCDYCERKYTGYSHISLYDKKTYTCNEEKVKSSLYTNKFFCSAKCALEYCKKTNY